MVRKPPKPPPKNSPIVDCTTVCGQDSCIGRGHKVCPGCHQNVGARTKKCKCGHEFSPKVKGWDVCKTTMLALIQAKRGGYTLAELATTRVKNLHDGCLLKECSMDNKQLQQLVTELVKSSAVVKDGKKYKANA